MGRCQTYIPALPLRLRPPPFHSRCGSSRRPVGSVQCRSANPRRAGLLCCPRVVLLSVQREVDRGAFLDLSFGPDASAMPLDDSLYGGKPYAHAWKLREFVQPLEGREQLVHIRHVEARAIVSHVIGGFALDWRLVELDSRGRVFAGELPCVGEQ